MFACNGGDGHRGECYQCKNTHCKQWIECDYCGEIINPDTEMYLDFGDRHYCSSCIEENIKNEY